MFIRFTFKQMEPTDGIRGYAKHRSERFEKYFSGRINVEWNFSAFRGFQIAHCHITGTRINYFVQASTQDLYASIDEAVDKMDKRLKRRKEISRNHLHRTHMRVRVA